MKPFNLDEYLANPNKKLVTRDGRKVTRVLCTDAKGKYPIIALIGITGEERVYSFMKNGCWSSPCEESINDLFFAPEKHEGWINLYKDDDIVYASMDTFKTKKDAESASCRTCIATIKIEWEE